jgi:cellulose synthase/poly-beta-1,6-N-acetylglucosamine synthase-like glycosyltransferase
MIFYIYLGYPFTAAVFALLMNKRVKKGPFQPSVTILIAAYNEEKEIEKTLKNKLDLDYPKDKLEIIIISDGSTDKTDDIVRNYTGERVRLIKQETRAGKTSALNLAVPHARGEVIAFSDANSKWAKNALAKLMNNFSEPNVGYVTGKMIYKNPENTLVGDGCTTYMKYENYLRSVETRIGSIVGVDGGIDAVRKELYRPLNLEQLPDFVLPLKVVEQGYRVIFEPGAILEEQALGNAKDEYSMRVRVSLRALWALKDMKQLLSFRKSRLFAWQLWSHKVLRYFCFIFLIVAFVSNFMLWPAGDLYRGLLITQILCYLSAIISSRLKNKGIRIKVFYLINYFVLLNAASAHAYFYFIKNKKITTWTPRGGI